MRFVTSFNKNLLSVILKILVQKESNLLEDMQVLILNIKYVSLVIKRVTGGSKEKGSKGRILRDREKYVLETSNLKLFNF